MTVSMADQNVLSQASALNATSVFDLRDTGLVLQELSDQLPLGFAVLLIPVTLLYLSIYAHLLGHNRVYQVLTVASVAAFSLSPYLAPIYCGPVRCLQNFAIAIGTMKALDIFARRHSLPTYTQDPRPPSTFVALLVLTELRYESFTPNHICVSRDAEGFSEPMQLALNLGIFAVLQTLPQVHSTVLAIEVLLAIHIIWTGMQLLLRYKSSPALFGPLYLADSLTGFWSETWHNAFASPCQSIAYNPIRYNLPRIGVPVVVARSFGVLAAFGLMAIFHMYALTPILPRSSIVRIGGFFFLNGVGTVVEAMIWGKRKHWLKAVLAWTFEIVLASWTAEGAHIPSALSRIPWRSMCGAPSEW